MDDEHGPLGPGGTRALTTAIMGTGQVRVAEVYLRNDQCTVTVQHDAHAIRS